MVAVYFLQEEDVPSREQPVAMTTSTQSDIAVAAVPVNVGGPPAQQKQGPGITVAPSGGGIELAASAKEARQRMRKKADAKQQASNLSLRDKYQLLQNL